MTTAAWPCSDVDIVTLQNPFDHLYRDSDVEGMTDGFDPATAYGEIYGVDDPSMVRACSCLLFLQVLCACIEAPPAHHAAMLLQGWSRYAQGTRHMAFNSGLFFIKASNKTIDLLTRIAGGNQLSCMFLFIADRTLCSLDRPSP